MKQSKTRTQPETVESNVRPIKLKDEAYIDLERLIVTGQLTPGAWVSETDLIKASGHTRASVRYAVQRLEDQKLIEVVPKRGAQICPIDFTTQFRALELRRTVESLIARCAAKRASAEQQHLFAELAEGFKKASKDGDQQLMTELDSKTYNLMLESADNPFAAKAMTSVKGLSRRFWGLHHKDHGDLPKMANCYADVTSAIAGGDAEGANAAVSRLIDYVEKFTLEVIGYTSTIK